MKAPLEFGTRLELLCLVNLLLAGYAESHGQNAGIDKFHQTNEESEWEIPSVSHLLKGLDVFEQLTSNGKSDDYKTAKKPTIMPWRPPKVFLKRFSNRKKFIHEWLHKFLASTINYRQGMKLSTRNSKERPKKVRSFQISDARVSGRGAYAISFDQKDFELKLNLRINGKQRHQQQHKQEQQQKPNPNLQTQRPPQPHQPRPTTANCIHSPFEREALGIHNRYRTMHGAPALILNCDMSKNATNYARTLADMDALVQSGYTERPNQGENLSLGCHGSRKQTAEEAIKTWFDEVCQYTFGKQGPQTGTNHFTQLVWKESRELGIGRASNKQPNGETCTFIVARYKPLGNFESGDDAYVKNIQKGTFDETYCRNIPKAGLEGGYGFKRFKSPNFNGIYGE